MILHRAGFLNAQSKIKSREWNFGVKRKRRLLVEFWLEPQCSRPNIRWETSELRFSQKSGKMKTELFAELLLLYIAITCRLFRVTPALQLHHIYATVWYRMKEFSKRGSPTKQQEKTAISQKPTKVVKKQFWSRDRNSKHEFW